jgi:hypothetical protein
MGIYPVKLKKWYSCRNKEDRIHRETLMFLFKFKKCETCGKKVKMRNAIGHHSLPFGYGDVWCNKYCFGEEV